MTTIEVEKLASELKGLLARASSGEEVIVTENLVPLARLLPLPPKSTARRVPGLDPGVFTVADDFDEPLPDDFWLGES
jgi:antitoxin (DNA-binding transcriptional repressor) of toxin-antitoxin stability system